MNKANYKVGQAGISHCVFEDLGGFEYVGFYPHSPVRLPSPVPLST